MKQHVCSSVFSAHRLQQREVLCNMAEGKLFHPDSEKIMGSVSLQPDMKDESTDLQLEENFLKRLKDKYCCRVKVITRWDL